MSSSSAFVDILEQLEMWWPNGDGNALRCAGTTWIETAEFIEEITSVLDSVALRLSENYRGGAADRFSETWAQWTSEIGYLRTTVADCRRLAAALNDFGTDVDVADRTLVQLIEQAIAGARLSPSIVHPTVVNPTVLPPEWSSWLQAVGHQLFTRIATRTTAATGDLEDGIVTCTLDAAPRDRPELATMFTTNVSWPHPGTPADFSALATGEVNFGAGQGTLPPTPLFESWVVTHPNREATTVAPPRPPALPESSAQPIPPTPPTPPTSGEQPTGQPTVSSGTTNDVVTTNAVVPNPIAPNPVVSTPITTTAITTTPITANPVATNPVGQTPVVQTPVASNAPTAPSLPVDSANGSPVAPGPTGSPQPEVVVPTLLAAASALPPSRIAQALTPVEAAAVAPGPSESQGTTAVPSQGSPTSDLTAPLTDQQFDKLVDDLFGPEGSGDKTAKTDAPKTAQPSFVPQPKTIPKPLAGIGTANPTMRALTLSTIPDAVPKVPDSASDLVTFDGSPIVPAGAGAAAGAAAGSTAIAAASNAKKKSAGSGFPLLPLGGGAATGGDENNEPRRRRRKHIVAPPPIVQ